MTPQQALEEAKKRYPEGTRYRCAINNNRKLTVESTDGFSEFQLDGPMVIHGEPGKGVLYDSRTDTWAEIIQPAKSLEERLVEEYGFKKNISWSTLNGYAKEHLSIHYVYDNGKLVSTELFINDAQITNPNNLEAFIKAYFGLFEK